MYLYLRFLLYKYFFFIYIYSTLYMKLTITKLNLLTLSYLFPFWPMYLPLHCFFLKKKLLNWVPGLSATATYIKEEKKSLIGVYIIYICLQCAPSKWRKIIILHSFIMQNNCIFLSFLFNYFILSFCKATKPQGELME